MSPRSYAFLRRRPSRALARAGAAVQRSQLRGRRTLLSANDDGRELSGTDQAALGALINIAGRQRMLAHRVAMLLALSQVPGASGDAGQLREAADAALLAY